jgi:hypothetical protein
MDVYIPNHESAKRHRTIELADRFSFEMGWSHYFVQTSDIHTMIRVLFRYKELKDTLW